MICALTPASSGASIRHTQAVRKRMQKLLQKNRLLGDFSAFLQMIANGGVLNGNRILKEETVALLFEDQTSTLLPEAFTRAFGEDVSSYMKFTAGFGMKMVDDGVDYFFWGGAANTFFWLDKDNDSLGVFATQLAPSVYNVSDSIEEIVDQARL